MSRPSTVLPAIELDVHDAAAPAGRDHPTGRRLRGQQFGRQVDPEDLLPGTEVDRFRPSDPRVAAADVEQHVYAAEARIQGVKGGVHRLGVAGVRGQALGLTARGARQRHGGLDGGQIQVRHEDRRSASGERRSSGPAERPGTGQEHDATVEPEWIRWGGGNRLRRHGRLHRASEGGRVITIASDRPSRDDPGGDLEYRILSLSLEARRECPRWRPRSRP